MTTHGNQRAFEAHYRASSYRPRPGYFAALHATRLQMLRELPATHRLLDIGCGSGAYLLPLHQDGRRVTGIDYSRTIFADLRLEAQARGIDAAGLDVLPGDARAMPFADGTFDAVFSFATLYAIPDIERALAEITRVLRPGGVAWLELGNTQSLNHIEAARVGTGLSCQHQSPARMRHLLRGAGLAVQRVRCFQIFPLWNGGTARARDLLNARLEAALGELRDGMLLDERISSSPWLQPFAFRQLLCVQKGGVEVMPAPVPALPIEDLHQQQARRQAAQRVARGDVAGGFELLLDCVRSRPDDPRPVLDLAALYDGDAERRLVRRWRRALTRCRRLPAEGVPLTAAPRSAPNAPKISIVLPTFDAAHLLPEAVQSVFDQTFADFELIVVDDGSRDDTGRYLQRLRDPRVQVLRHSNQRLPTALNRGFALARGELRTWISADNVCLPTMLEQLVLALDNDRDAVLAVAGFARVNQRLDRLSSITGQDVSFAGFLPRNPGVAAFAYRAATAMAVGDYAAALEGAEDWDYWLRLMEHGPAVLLPDVLYLYREHARSMSTTIPDRVRVASERTAQRWLERHAGLPTLAQLGGDPSVWFRLGTRLLSSPFVPVQAAIAALRKALEADPNDGRVLVQLAVAMARVGAFAPAAQLAQRFVFANDPGLRWLADQLRRLAAGDRSIDAKALPLLPADDQALVAAR